MLLGRFHKADPLSYGKEPVAAGIKSRAALIEKGYRGIYPESARSYSAVRQDLSYGAAFYGSGKPRKRLSVPTSALSGVAERFFRDIVKIRAVLS